MAKAKRWKKQKSKANLIYRGTTFRSMGEVRYAQQLDKLGILWEYEPDKFDWQPKVAKYTPDFKIFRKDAPPMYIEYKGYLRPKDRTKMRAIVKQHPELDIRMAFEDITKPLYTGSKTNYAGWSDKLGMPYAGQIFPESWMKGVIKHNEK